jgi:hypothetical protein
VEQCSENSDEQKNYSKRDAATIPGFGLVSMAQKENFSEPDHLGTLAHMLVREFKKIMKAAGWGAHYAVGLLFVLTYQELWKSGRIKKNLATGLGSAH